MAYPFNLWHTTFWAQARPYSCLKSWDSNPCQLPHPVSIRSRCHCTWDGSCWDKHGLQQSTGQKTNPGSLVYSAYLILNTAPSATAHSSLFLSFIQVMFFSRMLIEALHVCLIFNSFCSFGCTGCTPSGPAKLREPLFITVFYRSQMVYN